MDGGLQMMKFKVHFWTDQTKCSWGSKLSTEYIIEAENRLEALETINEWNQSLNRCSSIFTPRTHYTFEGEISD